MSQETKTETCIRTIPLELQTSNWKNDGVQEFIDEMGDVMEWMCSILPTYPVHRWGNDTHLYRHMGKQFPSEERSYYANHYQAAQTKVISSFNSWDSNGRPGNKPTPSSGNFAPMNAKYIKIEKNNGSFGAHLKFEPYTSGLDLWFGINESPYSRPYLEDVIDDNETSIGGSELHLHDDGSLYLHLVVKWPVEVYKKDTVDRYLGVDLNIDPMVAMTVVDSDGEIDGVEMESGKEFHHHRERLKKKKAQSQKNRSEHRVLWQKYTDNITNNASRRVVDYAAENAPIVIRLEDLTHYRESAQNPIHDWPYAEIQNKIKYKALEKRIPVETVNPRYTSITCRKCGVTNKTSRITRDKFDCCNCDYEVDADVNAAYNIATGGVV